MNSTSTFDLIAACAFGMEAVVRRELAGLHDNLELVAAREVVRHLVGAVVAPRGADLTTWRY